MKRGVLSVLVCGLVLATVGSAAAQCIDQESRTGPAYMARFSQGDLAQSFMPAQSAMSGAEVKTQPGQGAGGDITIELWKDGLPNAGGTKIAEGTDAGVLPGEYATVDFGGCVNVVPEATYYMVFLSTDGAMGLSGDTNNPYPRGMVYANTGFRPFPQFDYTFATFCDCGGGGCGENATLKVKCKQNGVKVKGILKKATPNMDVTFQLNGEQDQPTTTNNKGKAKAKWKHQQPGDKVVNVCDLRQVCIG